MKRVACIFTIIFLVILWATTNSSAQYIPSFVCHDYPQQFTISDMVLGDFNNDNVMDIAVFLFNMGIRTIY